MAARRSGVIVNLASIAASAGLANRFAYSMTKGAIVAMTLFGRARLRVARHPLRLDLAGAHSHAVRRRLPREALSRAAKPRCSPTLSATQPVGRMGTPREVADLALFSRSDEAGSPPAPTIPLDGGFLQRFHG